MFHDLQTPPKTEVQRPAKACSQCGVQHHRKDGLCSLCRSQAAKKGRRRLKQRLKASPEP